LGDQKEFLGEVLRELRRLREEVEELRFSRFVADEMRSLRKRILSSRYD